MWANGRAGQGLAVSLRAAFALDVSRLLHCESLWTAGSFVSCRPGRLLLAAQAS
jgi:hypothetical protein